MLGNRSNNKDNILEGQYNMVILSNRVIMELFLMGVLQSLAVEKVLLTEWRHK